MIRVLEWGEGKNEFVMTVERLLDGQILKLAFPKDENFFKPITIYKGCNVLLIPYLSIYMKLGITGIAGSSLMITPKGYWKIITIYDRYYEMIKEDNGILTDVLEHEIQHLEDWERIMSEKGRHLTVYEVMESERKALEREKHLNIEIEHGLWQLEEEKRSMAILGTILEYWLYIYLSKHELPNMYPLKGKLHKIIKLMRRDYLITQKIYFEYFEYKIPEILEDGKVRE